MRADGHGTYLRYCHGCRCTDCALTVDGDGNELPPLTSRTADAYRRLAAMHRTGCLPDPIEDSYAYWAGLLAGTLRTVLPRLMNRDVRSETADVLARYDEWSEKRRAA